jgi:molybdate transport system substrate-binding protein
MKSIIGALVGALTIALVHSPRTAESAEIVLFCSNAFRPVVTALAPQFEQSSGHKIVVRFMGTNLKPTIEAGEQFDLAISQSEVIESLIDQKKIGAGTSVAVAHTPIGVAIRAGAPRPDIGSIEAFKQTLLKAKAVTYSGEGRAGLVVAGIFERLGIADQMKSKSILFAGASGPKHVIDGSADLIIQTAAGITGVQGLEYIGTLPDGLQVNFVLMGGLSASAKQPDAAKAFLAFLRTPEAAKVIAARGMEAP